MTVWHLQGWSTCNLGNITLHLQISREIIPHLDASEDTRPLMPIESWQRGSSIAPQCTLERSIARQHTRCTWLQEGESNTTFFKIHAAHRQQENPIHELHMDNHIVTDERDPAKSRISTLVLHICLIGNSIFHNQPLPHRRLKL